MGSGGSIGVKILIVTYSYAPDLTPRAFRWSALATVLAGLVGLVQVLAWQAHLVQRAVETQLFAQMHPVLLDVARLRMRQVE